MKLRRGDKVVLIAGGRQFKLDENWDKIPRENKKGKNIWKIGLTGIIRKVFLDRNLVIVEWINIVKRFVKKTKFAAGKIEDVTKPIKSSKVMLVCPYTGEPTRIWFVYIDNKKYRYSKKAVKLKAKKPEEVLIK